LTFTRMVVYDYRKGGEMWVKITEEKTILVNLDQAQEVALKNLEGRWYLEVEFPGGRHRSYYLGSDENWAREFFLFVQKKLIPREEEERDRALLREIREV